MGECKVSALRHARTRSPPFDGPKSAPFLNLFLAHSLYNYFVSSWWDLTETAVTDD
jgi:hypothetical protein